MRLSFIAMVLCLASAASACSQQIHVVVVEAHHGKPVPHECINVSFGAWHGTDIIAATDDDGVATITIDHDQVRAKPVAGKMWCQGASPTAKSISTPQPPTTISVLTDWYVSCQYSKKLTEDPAWRNESPAQRIPSFSIQEILSHGVVATNSCSKLAPTTKPGDLVLVVRKRTFMEGMRS